MNKIGLIIKREYLTRVKKKSFIIMTFLGPLLFAGLMIVPVWLATRDKSTQHIEVIDETGQFENVIPSTATIQFDYPPITLDEAIRDFYETDYTAILFIPKNIGKMGQGNLVNLYYKKQPGINTETYVKNMLEKIIYDGKLIANKINVDVLRNAKTTVKVSTEKIHEDGEVEETNTGSYMIVGIVGGILIYMFIFFYGVQVMRGVIEEKTSRIVEVIISSVKPFQLMMGKILGIALVGLTQFTLWMVLTLALNVVAQQTLFKDLNKDIAIQKYEEEQVFQKGADLQAMQQAELNSSADVRGVFKSLQKLNFVEILFVFLFYFMGGYLLYAALFAAVGSAVDNESETQQFMMPITIPLIFSFIIAQVVTQDPESSLAFWFSMIPFTSPIIMMVRLPFGVPPLEIAASMLLLVLGFIATTWLAGKIYRTGILMYGKKVTYKELWKWLFYRS